MYATTMGLALIDIYLLGCSESSPEDDCYPMLNYDDPILLNTLEWIRTNTTLHLPDDYKLRTPFVKHNFDHLTTETTMRKPVYLPAPPAEIHLEDMGNGFYQTTTKQFRDWTPNPIRAQEQLTELRHREAQIAATVGVIVGIFVTLVVSHSMF